MWIKVLKIGGGGGKPLSVKDLRACNKFLEILSKNKMTSALLVAACIFCAPVFAEEDTRPVYDTPFLITDDKIHNIYDSIYKGIDDNCVEGLYYSNYSYKGMIEEIINVDFINNKRAILNNITIGTIKGNFIGNSGAEVGAAIYNTSYYISRGAEGIINQITQTTFEQNTATQAGGAIFDSGFIKEISDSVFEDNKVISDFRSDYSNIRGGGALYVGESKNASSDGTNIVNSEFKNNSVYTTEQTAYGGAIASYIFYNNKFPDNNDQWQKAHSYVTNSKFYDNYAVSELETAKGGAIYTSTNFDIIADNGTSVFSGNYVKDINGERQEAVYVESPATLTLKAVNNGSIRFDDQINGSDGYTLNLTGDGTGTVSLYNDVLNANVKADNVTIDFANGEVKEYVFDSIKIGENTRINVDVDVTDEYSPVADTISTKGASEGSLIVNSINLIGDYKDNPITVQIIKNTNPDSKLELTLSEVAILPDIGDTVTNNQIITDAGNISITTTDTQNDSIIIQDKIYDNLAVINDKSGERSFVFESSDPYLVKEDLSAATEGTINIIGLENGPQSVIDAQSHSLFDIQNKTNLNISNVEIKNAFAADRAAAINYQNLDASLNINNVSFTNNSSNSIAGAVYLDGKTPLSAEGDYPTINVGYVAQGAFVDSDGNVLKGTYVLVNLDTQEELINSAELDELIASGANINFIDFSDPEHVDSIPADEFQQMIEEESGLTFGSFDECFDWYIKMMEDLNPDILEDYFIGSNPEDYYEANKPVLEPENFATADEVRAVNAVNFENVNFTNNHADSDSAKAGAIYSKGNLKLTANDGKTHFISGNYTTDSSGNKEDNAIYMDKNSKLILDSVNSSNIQIDDKITGDSYNVYLIGDDKSKITLNNKIVNSKSIHLYDTTLHLAKDESVLDDTDFTAHSGTIDFINDNIGQTNFNSFNITGDIKVNVDADLGAESMDRLPENTTITNGAMINVDKINLTSDAENQITTIPFAYDSFKGSVVYDPQQLSKETQVTQLFAPIYKYEVSYNPEDGMFTFVRGNGSSAGDFNPAVVAPSVATQAGAYTTQMQTFNYAFHHADTFMNIPYLERITIINQNKYALSPTGNATDVGTFSPLLTKEQTAGFWVKPYASFENIPLKNGPKVSNINYGTLVGYDSPLTSVAKGWERVLTGYIGYNGASQRYSGVDTYQNGGILGGTITMYKGNFFNATTVSVGASSGNTNNMYGSENYTMLLSGIGNKTGYNIEFKEGKYIIQPSMLISYTFVNTFDYTNAAGLRIESDPLHAIQLAPGIKFIMNTKNGWQPYIGVDMVWNLLDKSEVRANDVRLPEMSIKPYVQYGIGVQKLIKDRFVAYGQAMMHNGGRNGISLTAGFRWKIGKE